MYDNRKYSKIKKDKVLRWQVELSEYDYSIIYLAGKEYVVPDTLSRA